MYDIWLARQVPVQHRQRAEVLDARALRRRSRWKRAPGAQPLQDGRGRRRALPQL